MRDTSIIVYRRCRRRRRHRVTVFAAPRRAHVFTVKHRFVVIRTLVQRSTIPTETKIVDSTLIQVNLANEPDNLPLLVQPLHAACRASYITSHPPVGQLHISIYIRRLLT